MAGLMDDRSAGWPGMREDRRVTGRSSGRRLEVVARAEVAQGLAELVPDPDRPQSWTLLVEGTPQSHVDLLDPTHLEFEYVRWLGHAVDLIAEAQQPLNVLHLGGGSWTLARYVAATRPGSRQRVVEVDAALVEFVRQRLPSVGTGIRVRTGDARAVLTGLTSGSVDLVVVDIFAGARIPAHVTSREFVAQAARVLRPGGTYAVNLADGPPLGFARAQAATVASVFPQTLLVGSAQVMRGRRFGNVVLLGGREPIPVAGLTRRTAADPFPARVVSGDDLVRFIAGARPVTDVVATPSPLPPVGMMEG
jgi:SAM-dependent methyltransferase